MRLNYLEYTELEKLNVDFAYIMYITLIKRLSLNSSYKQN